jgi:hypothetical protein
VSRRNPWSRPIDYDKAIAEDKERIEVIERCLANGWVCPAGYPGARLVDLLLHDLSKPESPSQAPVDREKVRATVNLTDAELAGLAYLCDIDGYEGGSYRVGEEVFARLAKLVGNERTDVFSESRLRDELKHVKAALSRHRRNQEKFGRAAGGAP